MEHKGRILGGILLISGTAIGAGMLALPLSTAENGFGANVIAFFICWLCMTVTALLLVEVNLWLPGERDVISLVGATLGNTGKAVAWVTYLFLLYALICAYFSGTSSWMGSLIQDYFNIQLSHTLATFFIAVIFGVIVSFGTGLTEHINRYLAFGLVIAFGILIATALSSVKMSNISFGQLSNTPSNFPLLITAFGFSVILPSLTNYLERDSKALQKVVIIGSIIPLFVYLLWELVAFGIIPLEGPDGLRALKSLHDDGTGVARALQHAVGNPWITHSSQWFAIFAILTSLLGVSLSLVHFLSDGLKIRIDQIKNRIGLILLTYIPPILIILFFPSGFSRVLSFAGLFVAVLFGILPVLMVWRSRYDIKLNHHNRNHATKSTYRVWGGKPLLIVLMCFFVYVMYLEMQNCFICP